MMVDPDDPFQGLETEKDWPWERSWWQDHPIAAVCTCAAWVVIIVWGVFQFVDLLGG